MSDRTAPRLPKYRHDRPKDLAVVRIDGRDVYLGRYAPGSGKGRPMLAAHDPPLREGQRGDAARGLDWLSISVPISEDMALRLAALCFLGPLVDHDHGPALLPTAGGDREAHPAAHPDHPTACRGRGF